MRPPSSRQIRVNDVVKLSTPKELACMGCGGTFEVEFKVVHWYPPKTSEYFCSEGCQKAVRDRDLAAMTVPDERPFWLYVLKLKDDFYYVGVTMDLKDRLKQHFSIAGGAIWTRLHPPVKCVHQEKTEIFDHQAIRVRENELTLQYAELHGYDKVRGGKYCSVNPRWPSKVKEIAYGTT